MASGVVDVDANYGISDFLAVGADVLNRGGSGKAGDTT